MKNKEYRDRASQLIRLVPAHMLHGLSMDKWARAAGLLGIVAVAMAMAQLTWRVVPQPVGSSTGQLPAAARQVGASQRSIADLIESQLFGLPLAQPGGAIDAPETTLNLTLRGIFALDSQRALAIIASGGSDELPYKVGDTLPGGAKVHEIAPDKVILERGGRFETLTLPKESLDLNAAMPGAAVAKPAARLGEIRNRLRANPAEVISMNAVQPVMENGQLKGYRLGDNPYMPVLREAGLMPGDVVTRVNGIAVTDQARAAEVLNQLSSAGHIVLEVERGGTPVTLSVDLGR